MSWQAALDELVERQEAALRDRRWDDLSALQEEQRAFLAALPPLTPAARPALARALQASLDTQRSLAGSLVETKGALERLRRSRPAIAAYGGTARSGIDARA
jgi:hypothetical protein